MDEQPAPQPAFVPPPQPSTKVHLPSAVKLALLLFLIDGGLIAAILPRSTLNTGHQPSISLLFGAGVAVIIVTAIFFQILSRLNLGFGRSALVLALGYNATIVVIKFIISPVGFYKSGEQGLDFQNFNPNTSIYYLATAAFIFALYFFVFRLIYRHFEARLHRDASAPRPNFLIRTKEFSKRHKFLLGLVILATILTGGGILMVPLVVAFVAAPDQYGYLIRVAAAMAIPLLAAIVLAIYVAYKSFDEVSKQAVATGNAALLSTFFWIGVCLIAAYHIMWVILMITLVSLWPFNTTTSK